jgi:DNA-binding XRE family transcriptional regulator
MSREGAVFMTKPQFIENEGKRAFVVLPIAEWRRIEEILEDATDIAALEACARNPTETFPADVADALIAGQSPVRVFRVHRNLSQIELALNAAVSVPYLNQIEAGKRKPSVEVMKRIASALSVPLDALVI